MNKFNIAEFVMKLLTQKLIFMIADFSAIDRHKMYEFKRNDLLNVLNVQIAT